MTKQLDTSAAAIAALLDGVTPGPWGISFRRDGTGYICMGSPHGGPHKQFDIPLEKGYRNDERDSEFIGFARDLVPALSAELTALRAERDAALARVGVLEAALVFYDGHQQDPNDGPWGINSTDFGDVARTALAKGETL